jgi:hypothetical protein
MRTETKTVEIYNFEDLATNQELKEKVLNNLSNINTSYDWWGGTYDDAKIIGFKITGFDLYANKINIEQIDSASEVCANILANHGDECSTYKLAESFIDEFTPKFAEYWQTEEGEDELIEMETQFFNDLASEYLYILKSELEYLESEAAILEAIQMNDYEFTIDGNIY